MSGFTIKSFKGQIPKLAPRLLSEEFAQMALDCQMRTQELAPIYESVDTGFVFDTPPERIYAYYTPDIGDFAGWFWFDFWTDAVFNVLPNDLYDRVYFYDIDGNLRITDKDNINVNASIPSVTTSWPLGVPAPTTKPTVSDAGGGSSPSVADRVYVYTFVDHWGAEGPPSPASSLLPQMATDDTANVSGFEAFPAGYNFTNGKYRIYRSVTGSVLTDYQYVGEVSSGTFNDDKLASELGEVIPTRSWYPPESDVQGMCLAPNGSLVAFKDNTIFMSEPYMPSAWPPEYQHTVDADIVSVAPFSASVAVLTNSHPYTISGAIPVAAQVRKMDNEEACINKKATVTIGNGVYYASPNGISMVSQGGAQIASRESMTREQWANFNPTEAQAFVYDDKYGLIYDSTGLLTSDIHGISDPYAPQTGIWWMDNDEKFYKSWSCASGVPAVRPDDEALFVYCDGAFVQKNMSPLDGALPIEYKWVSKEFEAERPVCYSVLQIEADDYPILVSVFADDRRVYYNNVVNGDAVRLPGGFKAKTWVVQLQGKSKVYKINVYESMAELSAV